MMVRKILPRGHLKQKFPGQSRKIHNASARYGHDTNHSQKTYDDTTHDFSYKDVLSGAGGGHVDGPAYSGPDTAGVEHSAGTSMRNSIKANDHDEKLLEYFECYEKVQVPYVNVFYRTPPNESMMVDMQQQVDVHIKELQEEMQVQMEEKRVQMEEAVSKGEMLPERFELEMKNAGALHEQQIESRRQQKMSELQASASKIENNVVTEKEFKVLAEDKTFQQMLVETIPFYDNRIKQTIVV